MSCINGYLQRIRQHIQLEIMNAKIPKKIQANGMIKIDTRKTC